MSLDIVNKLIKEAGFKIVKNSLDFEDDKRKSNLYYNRDILLLLALNS